jgi:hypothetical protein
MSSLASTERQTLARKLEKDVCGEKVDWEATEDRRQRRSVLDINPLCLVVIMKALGPPIITHASSVKYPK